MNHCRHIPGTEGSERRGDVLTAGADHLADAPREAAVGAVGRTDMNGFAFRRLRLNRRVLPRRGKVHSEEHLDLVEVGRQDKKDEEQKREEVKENYHRFLDETDARIELLYNKAVEQRENDYQKCSKEFEDSAAIESLKKAIEDFSKFEDYKDSKLYIDK